MAIGIVFILAVYPDFGCFIPWTWNSETAFKSHEKPALGGEMLSSSDLVNYSSLMQKLIQAWTAFTGFSQMPSWVFHSFPIHI